MGCLRDCTSGIAKYIIFLLNLLILICAVVLIALAVLYRTQNAGLDLMSVSSLAIAVGVLIALIAFFGCCGAIKESSCMLTTYAGILLALFIIQAVLGILAFVVIKNGDNQLKDEVTKHLTNLYVKYTSSTEDADIIDALQRNLKCCGLNGPSSAEVQINSTAIISSCCPKDVITCSKDTSSVYSEGCVSALTEFLQDSIKVIGIVAIIFALIELVAAIFAFYIRNSSR